MNRIFICADTHGLLNIKKIKRLAENKKLTYEDYINSRKLINDIAIDVKYKKWFCGHWHTDEKMGNNQVLFEKIVEI